MSENNITEMQEAQTTGVVVFEEKKEEKEKSANYTHKFSEPVEIEGKKYKELTFYFDKMTGSDIEAIEDELAAQNQYVISPELSSKFQSMLAARAAGIAADEVKRFKVKDYMKIKNKARDFLLAVGY